MSWTNLKAAIASAIKTNNNQEITGAILQNTLTSIVNSVGANATFAGVAIPSTNPGTPDGPVFWIAGQAGTYPNFGNAQLPAGVNILLWNANNSTWSANTVLNSGDILNNSDTIFNANAYLYGINDTTHTLTLQEAINAAYDAGLNNVARVISFRALEGSESVGKIAIFNSGARISQFRDTAYWTVFDKSVINAIININARFGTWTSKYTFDVAVSLVPESERTVARGIIYRSSEDGSLEGTMVIAIFNGQTSSRWTQRDYWTIFDKKEIDVAINSLLNSIDDIYQKLPYNLGDNIDLSSYWVNGRRINQSGTIATSSDSTNKATNKIAIANIIDRSKKWYVAGYPMGGTLSVMVAYYDTNESFISFQYNDGNLGDTLNSGFLNIPDNAVFIAFANMFSKGNFTLREAEPISVDEYVEGKLNTKLDANLGAEHSGKYLQVLYDGSVGYGDGSSPEAGSINVIDQQTIFVGNNIRGAATLGQGWSGNDQNGYTHTSGSAEPLVFAVPVTQNSNYIVRMSLDTVRENTVLIKMGNSYEIDPYNGNVDMIIGFKSDGIETLTITPESSFDGTVTNIEVLPVVDESSAADSMQLTVYNVGTSSFTNLVGFWNVAIGNPNAMSNNVNATRSIAIGYSALSQYISGSRNIGIGTFALAQLKFGKGNIGIGADTYYRRQGGDDNVAIGRACMGGSTESVNNNTCIGRSAGERVTGDGNICIGTTAGYMVASGNVCVGLNTGFSHNLGNNNIFIGRNAGYSGAQKNGSWNTVVGPTAYVENNVSKSVALGYLAKATKSNQNVIGSNESVETKVYGDLVVHGTDGIDRKIVFNQDGTVSWESVS